MAKKVVLPESALREQMTGAVPVFVLPTQAQPTGAQAEHLPLSEEQAQEAQAQPTGAQAEHLLLSEAQASEAQAQPTATQPAAQPAAAQALAQPSEGSEAAPPQAEWDGEDKDLQRYEKMFLHRSLIGLPRTNVGISMATLSKVEQVINRLFEGQIAASTFVDNIVYDHLTKYEKQYNRWLQEKPKAIF
ncbi:MAG: DUF3408 domain-containing protein [Prevotellaceae bacterium]|jgi:hypothetical protein|nr:DUF3408 domain-containing protein [Prevotellaceae bacterium]